MSREVLVSELAGVKYLLNHSESGDGSRDLAENTPEISQIYDVRNSDASCFALSLEKISGLPEKKLKSNNFEKIGGVERRVTRRIKKSKKGKKRSIQSHKAKNNPRFRNPKDAHTFLSVSSDDTKSKTAFSDRKLVTTPKKDPEQINRILNGLINRASAISSLSNVFATLAEKNAAHLKPLDSLEKKYSLYKSQGNQRHLAMIDQKIKNIRTSLEKENEEMISMSQKVCQVCSLGECIYEDDVFIYCEYCNILVHRICVGVSMKSVKSEPWVCQSCSHKCQQAKKDLWLKYFFDVGCSLKSGLKHGKILKERKQASTRSLKKRKSTKRGPNKNRTLEISKIIKLPRTAQNFKILRNLTEHCVACGRLGGVLFPVEGIPDHFCHVSCAYWQPQLTIIPDKQKVIFVDSEDLRTRSRALIQDYLPNTPQIFLSASFWALDREITGFFCRNFSQKSFKILVKKIGLVKKSTVEYLESVHKQKNSAISKRRFGNLFKKLASPNSRNGCLCLFKGPVLNFIQKSILRNFLNQMKSLGFEIENMPPRKSRWKNKKKRDLINDLGKKVLKIFSAEFFEVFPYKSNRKQQKAQNQSCKDCQLQPKKICQICLDGRGLLVKCKEKSCEHFLHVECGRRVRCELVCPTTNSSDFSAHQIYCQIHSKSEDLRKRDNLLKRIENEEAEISQNLETVWEEYTSSKNSVYKKKKRGRGRKKFASNGRGMKVFDRRFRHSRNRLLYYNRLQEANRDRLFPDLPSSESSIFTQIPKDSKNFSANKKVVWHLTKFNNSSLPSEKTSVSSESGETPISVVHSPKIVRNLIRHRIPKTDTLGLKVANPKKDKKCLNKDGDSIFSSDVPGWGVGPAKQKFVGGLGKGEDCYRLDFVQFLNNTS